MGAAGTWKVRAGQMPSAVREARSVVSPGQAAAERQDWGASQPGQGGFYWGSASPWATSLGRVCCSNACALSMLCLPLSAESQHAETIFRDRSGRKRDLKQERIEQRKKAEEKSERDGQYAKWGKG